MHYSSQMECEERAIATTQTNKVLRMHALVLLYAWPKSCLDLSGRIKVAAMACWSP